MRNERIRQVFWLFCAMISMSILSCLFFSICILLCLIISFDFYWWSGYWVLIPRCLPSSNYHQTGGIPFHIYKNHNIFVDQNDRFSLTVKTLNFIQFSVGLFLDLCFRYSSLAWHLTSFWSSLCLLILNCTMTERA